MLFLVLGALRSDVDVRLGFLVEPAEGVYDLALFSHDPEVPAALAAWAVATFLFGLDIAHVHTYQVTYGALAGVVILMLWFYLSAFILLVGGEINRLMSDELDQSLDLE